MAKRKAEIEKKRMLLLKSGERYQIVAEDARYYRCEGTQFRKSNPSIERVEEVKENADG